MTRRSDDDDERAAFLAEVTGVRPLAPGRKRVPVVPGAAAPRLLAKEGPGKAGFTVDVAAEHVRGRAQGVNESLLRELARAEPEERIDLHGMPVARAEASLAAVLAGAASRGHTTVLVIHGKGVHSGVTGPVLRDVVVERLTKVPLAGRVLGLATAPPRLGGAGALMVRLRR